VAKNPSKSFLVGAMLTAPVLIFLSWFGFVTVTSLSQSGSSRAPIDLAELQLGGLEPEEKLEKIREALPEVPTQMAVEALFELLRQHPQSPVVPDAIDLLGELRLKQIFSTEPADFKKGYLVEPGDSLRGVAINQNSTPGAIMRANNMLDDTLHPGQRLEIPVLNTNAVLHLAEERLVLYLEGRFLQSYPLELTHLADWQLREPLITEVEDKPSVAAAPPAEEPETSEADETRAEPEPEAEIERVRYGDLRYYHSSRRITLDNSPLVIYSDAAPAQDEGSAEPGSQASPAPEPPRVGVRLSRPHMEEVFLLLTGNSRVKIIP
jgi:LysM repeat protein